MYMQKKYIYAYLKKSKVGCDLLNQIKFFLQYNLHKCSPYQTAPPHSAHNYYYFKIK